jgi:hypothetical protein
VSAVGDVGAPQQRAVRANEAVTANLDRLLEQLSGMDSRGLEVYVSPDDRMVPDVNAFQIAEANRVELNPLADRRPSEAVESIQDRGSAQHPKCSLESAKQLVAKEPAKVLRTPHLRFQGLAPCDRAEDEENECHAGQWHQREPKRSRQQQLEAGQPRCAEVEQDQERDDTERKNGRLDEES